MLASELGTLPIYFLTLPVRYARAHSLSRSIPTTTFQTPSISPHNLFVRSFVRDKIMQATKSKATYFFAPALCLTATGRKCGSYARPLLGGSCEPSPRDTSLKKRPQVSFAQEGKNMSPLTNVGTGNVATGVKVDSDELALESESLCKNIRLLHA